MVFSWLDSPKRAIEWSPWEKKDPNVKKTFSLKFPAGSSDIC